MIAHVLTLTLVALLPATALASTGSGESLDLTRTSVGYLALAVFAIAYLLVMLEEFTALRKSKPVILAAGIIWIAIALAYASTDLVHLPEQAARHNLLEYAELAFFLLVAMTYVNAMQERRVFDALRSWMVRKGFSLRQVFWLTGLLAFFISPVADNLTTALLMCAVVMAVGGHDRKFIGVSCVNIVVAANAGGAFSPFGDITTLMVWQKGKVEFATFLALFVPAVVNWLVPAFLMSLTVSRERPQTSGERVLLKRGAISIVVLFLLTIATAVTFHNVLHLPPVMGMFTGLALLQFYGYYLKKTFHMEFVQERFVKDPDELDHEARIGTMVPFDVFNKVARAEWDTLLFFFGVVMCVGGLGFIGYLGLASEFLYSGMGATWANIAIGVLSAIVDNIPVMFAVLSMDPQMSVGQWLLVTLTAGVGGSLLSIGSAAGVALMGQAHGKYTFVGHLKWTPAIALGYVGSIYVHLWLNRSMF